MCYIDPCIRLNCTHTVLVDICIAMLTLVSILLVTFSNIQLGHYRWDARANGTHPPVIGHIRPVSWTKLGSITKPASADRYFWGHTVAAQIAVTIKFYSNLVNSCQIGTILLVGKDTDFMSYLMWEMWKSYYITYKWQSIASNSQQRHRYTLYELNIDQI